MQSKILILCGLMAFGIARQTSASIVLDVEDKSVQVSPISATSFTLSVYATSNVTQNVDTFHFEMDFVPHIAPSNIELLDTTVVPTPTVGSWNTFVTDSVGNTAPTFITDYLTFDTYLNNPGHTTLAANVQTEIARFSMEVEPGANLAKYIATLSNIEITSNGIDIGLGTPLSGYIATPEPASVTCLIGMAGLSLLRRKVKKLSVV